MSELRWARLPRHRPPIRLAGNLPVPRFSIEMALSHLRPPCHGAYRRGGVDKCRGRTGLKRPRGHKTESFERKDDDRCEKAVSDGCKDLAGTGAAESRPGSRHADL